MSGDDTRRVLLQRDGPIARLVLNRPDSANALDPATCAELFERAAEVEGDPDVRVLVFTAKGTNFSVGGDLSSLLPMIELPPAARAPAMENNVVQMANRFCHIMDRLPVPVIASVRGGVVGGGLGFACGADFIIASETAYFLPAHIHVGLPPDGGESWHLPRLVGPARAKAMLMLGEKVDAAQALAIGLVYKVVPDAELEDETAHLAARLAASPSHAIAGVKTLVNRMGQHGFSDHLQMEARIMGDAARSSDFPEGVRAFAERRKPVFGGQDADT